MIVFPALATAALAAVPTPLPQAPGKPAQAGEIAATYRIGGQPRTLTRSTVALELARRHRNGPTGKAAVDHLIETLLVSRAARAQGLMPASSEIRTEVQKIETALKQRKMQLDTILARSRLSRAEFEAKTALGIAQRRLTAKVLGISPDKVTAQQLALWTREQRNKVAIETDPAKLPSGVLARVGAKDEVTNLDVGRVLFTKLAADALRNIVNHIVFEECVAYEAGRLGIELTRAEAEREFARRKRAFEGSGKSKGIGYEQWLQAFGRTKEAELKSKSLRTKLLHGKLVERRYPEEVLDERLQEHRAAMLRRHGARRDLSTIFVRATDEPNKLLRRDFPAALTHIREIRQAIVDKKRSFALMAKIASDDNETKQNGGRIGWQNAEYLPGSHNQRAPTEVLEAAFAMKIGEVSEPIKTKEGYYLVWVSGVEDEPATGVIHKRMLTEMAERYNKALYEGAHIEYRIR